MEPVVCIVLSGVAGILHALPKGIKWLWSDISIICASQSTRGLQVCLFHLFQRAPSQGGLIALYQQSSRCQFCLIASVSSPQDCQHWRWTRWPSWNTFVFSIWSLVHVLLVKNYTESYVTQKYTVVSINQQKNIQWGGLYMLMYCYQASSNSAGL